MTVSAPVVVVSHDSGGNALGRARILADLLQARHDVRIVAFGTNVWEPMRHDRRVRLIAPPRTNLGIPRAVARLRKEIASSSVVVAIKPRVLSFGLAAAAAGHRRLVVDIDDFEPAFVRRRLGFVRQAFWPDHWPVTRLLERYRPSGTAVTVASRALQSRYGGMWLPHVRDRDSFMRDRLIGREIARATLHVDSDQLVLGFIGTVRVHKGLDVLASSLEANAKAVLLIAGQIPEPDAVSKLRAIDQSRVRVLKGPAIEDVGHAFAAVDVAVIPQSASLAAKFQSPAKLLDAMAAGLPIVTSRIGDAELLLDGSGITVPPDDPRAVVGALATLQSEATRHQLGAAARQRYLGAFTPEAWVRRLEQHIWANAIGAAQ